jgi:chromosome segregation ATPase
MSDNEQQDLHDMTEKERELWNKIQELESQTKRLNRLLGETKAKDEVTEIRERLKEKEERMERLYDALAAQEKRLKTLEANLTEPEPEQEQEPERETEPIPMKRLRNRWL